MEDLNITQTLEKVANFKREGNEAALTEFCVNHFYDWFCSDKALPRKAKSLMAKVKMISSSKKFDNDTTYVWFKNNCPCSGSLYDDFRIADLATGDVLYTITPKDSHAHGQATVWGRENKFQEPLIVGSWKEVKAWFLA